MAVVWAYLIIVGSIIFVMWDAFVPERRWPLVGMMLIIALLMTAVVQYQEHRRN